MRNFKQGTTQERGRIIAVRPGDRLVYKGWEIDLGVLDAIVSSGDKRLLWRFTQRGNRVQPVAVSESDCIWLTPEGKARGT